MSTYRAERAPPYRVWWHERASDVNTSCREGPSVSRLEAERQNKVLLNKDDFVERCVE